MVKFFFWGDGVAELVVSDSRSKGLRSKSRQEHEKYCEFFYVVLTHPNPVCENDHVRMIKIL